jgi:hypothetical protein
LQRVLAYWPNPESPNFPHTAALSVSVRPAYIAIVTPGFVAGDPRRLGGRHGSGQGRRDQAVAQVMQADPLDAGRVQPDISTGTVDGAQRVPSALRLAS